MQKINCPTQIFINVICLLQQKSPLINYPIHRQCLSKSVTCMMKKILLSAVCFFTCMIYIQAQNNSPNDQQRNDIVALIDKYSEAREKRDTVLLKKILTPDIDQLVSTGEWREGIGSAVQGMLKSSASTPGTRTLTVDKIKLFNATTAIVDCRYEIQNTDGTVRKMWSTFVVIAEKKQWKISAIRNMLPSPN